MKRYEINCGYLGEQVVECEDGRWCEYAEAETEIARLRKALEFYADTNNYEPYMDEYGEEMITNNDKDMGKLAREALAPKGEKE